MKNEVVETTGCPELDSECHEKDSLSEYLDNLSMEILDLAERMDQVKAISIMASCGLDQAFSRSSAYAKENIKGIFRAIECLAEVENS